MFFIQFAMQRKKIIKIRRLMLKGKIDFAPKVWVSSGLEFDSEKVKTNRYSVKEK